MMKKLLESMDRFAQESNDDWTHDRSAFWEEAKRRGYSLERNGVASLSAIDASGQCVGKFTASQDRTGTEDSTGEFYDNGVGESSEFVGSPFRRDEQLSEVEGADFVSMGAQVFVRGNEGGSPLTVVSITDDQQCIVSDENGQRHKVMMTDLVPAGVQESAYGPDEQLADLTKIRTDKLQELHALHRHYGQTNPRNKESANRAAAELAKRGIMVPVDESADDWWEDEDKLAESIRAAFEDYVSNEKYDADHIYPGKKKGPAADKKPVKAPKTIDPTIVAEEYKPIEGEDEDDSYLDFNDEFFAQENDLDDKESVAEGADSLVQSIAAQVRKSYSPDMSLYDQIMSAVKHVPKLADGQESRGNLAQRVHDYIRKSGGVSEGRVNEISDQSKENYVGSAHNSIRNKTTYSPLDRKYSPKSGADEKTMRRARTIEKTADQLYQKDQARRDANEGQVNEISASTAHRAALGRDQQAKQALAKTRTGYDNYNRNDPEYKRLNAKAEKNSERARAKTKAERIANPPKPAERPDPNDRGYGKGRYMGDSVENPGQKTAPKKAVVSTNKPIGFRVSDIGAGGKEYNVKTDKAWDDQHKTNESDWHQSSGDADEVHNSKGEFFSRIADAASAGNVAAAKKEIAAGVKLYGQSFAEEAKRHYKQYAKKPAKQVNEENYQDAYRLGARHALTGQKRQNPHPREYPYDLLHKSYNTGYKDNHRPVKRVKAAPVDEAKGENRALWDKINSKGVMPGIDRERYTDLSHEGLEGPFRMHNGKVVYYDPKAGQYYDRDTDMYISNEEMDTINHFGLKEDYAEFPDSDEMHSASELKHSNPMDSVASKGDAQSRVNSMMKTIRKIMLQLQNPSLRREEAAKLEASLDSIKQNFAQLKSKFGVKGVALEDTPIVPAAQPVPAKPGQPAQAGAPAVSSAQTSENPPGTPPQATASRNSPPTAAPASNPQQAPAQAGQAAQQPQTPVEQIKGLLKTLSTSPNDAKQLVSKLGGIH